jgi:hypothetical protein
MIGSHKINFCSEDTKLSIPFPLDSDQTMFTDEFVGIDGLGANKKWPSQRMLSPTSLQKYHINTDLYIINEKERYSVL